MSSFIRYKWLGSRATLMSWSIPLWEDESMLTAPPVQVNAPKCSLSAI